MKKIIFLLFLIFSSIAYSYESVVIVLQASLYKEANENSTILQSVRKGERVYILPPIDFNADLPEYLPSYDRTGNLVYIKSKYIKFITNDEKEKLWPSTLGKTDPTDYRLEEPIPATYPFLDHEFGRASFDFTIGSNPLAPYDYGTELTSQTYSAEKGIKFLYTQKKPTDKDNRYYSGFIASVGGVRNIITFKNGGRSEENRLLLRVGPYVSYDAFRNSTYRFFIGAGATVNFHQSYIAIENSEGAIEQRVFNGFSVSPIASIGFEYDDIYPKYDLIFGSDFSFYLPHTQTAPKSSDSQISWNGDKIHSSMRAQPSFFIGVQTKY